MEKIYLISGLGADERVFRYLELKKYEKCTVKWIKPQDNESLQDYCKRLLPQIDSPNPVIAGLSFGGIVANEIAKLIPVKQVILISSVRSWHEVPWFYRLGLHRFVPWGVTPRLRIFLKYYFQMATAEHMKLMMDMARSSPPAFMGWVAHAAVNWRGEVMPGFKQIHGDRDLTFPLSFIKQPDRVIKGTGHAMIIQRAKEVSEFIDEI